MRRLAFLVLALALYSLDAPAAPRARTTPRAVGPGALTLRIVNKSNYTDDKIFFIITSALPTAGYFDFSTGQVVRPGVWAFDQALMTRSLAAIKALSGDNTYTVGVGDLQSGRVYFSLGENFTTFPSSGPATDKSNTLLFDKFELHYQAGGAFNNVNQTNVDYFAIPYTLDLKDKNKQQAPVTVGIATPAETIFKAFEAIPALPDAQQSGNTNIMKSLLVRNGAQTVRALAPKSAAYSDLDPLKDEPQKSTHFFDDYVNTKVFQPGRTFNFPDKLLHQTYYGRVSADGLTISLFTDAGMTTPYAAVPTIGRTSLAWGSPDFAGTPSYWHNDGVNSTVPSSLDWGYILGGQATGKPGFSTYVLAHDPVAMAIPVSIVRGVAHYNTAADWMNFKLYYQGAGGVSTHDQPIYYYGKILHDFAGGGRAYALSYDDIFGEVSSQTFFSDPNVTLTIYPMLSSTLLSPTVSQFFGDVSIPVGGTTSLTFNLANPNATAAVTGISFAETLPAGLTVATGAATACGGTLTTTAPGTIGFAGGTLAGAATCSLGLTVTGETAGLKSSITGPVSSTEGGTGSPSNTDTVTVGAGLVSPPTIAKAFGASTLAVGGATTLTFTLSNPATNVVPLTGISFSDAFPAGLSVRTPNGLTGSCGGGTITAAAGSGGVSLAGATLAPGGACSFSVDVVLGQAGLLVNTTGAVGSVEGGPGGTALASIVSQSAETAVPALGTAGLAILAASLALLGVSLLRGRFPIG